MSLRLRLALWYGGLSGVLVVVVSVLAYALHSRTHYEELDRVLVAATVHMAEEYAAAGTPQQRSAILDLSVAPSFSGRVYDVSGRLVAAGRGADLAPSVDPGMILAWPSEPAFDWLAGLAPSMASAADQRGVLSVASGPDGGRWRLYALPIDGTTDTLVAAVTLGIVDASMGTIRRLLPLVAFVGAGGSLLGGFIVAGAALRPVATLTEAAGAIAGSRGFSRRVPGGLRRDELGRLAATFNAMLDSLDQAYSAQQRFVSDASHELRAPLTAIEANLELLARLPDMAAAERQAAIAEAGREARRLSRLVADLLVLARADAGVPLRRQRVELDRVLLDSVVEARHLVHGQRLEVETLEPMLVEGDADRLKQLILILLNNAINYTQAGGQISLGLRRDRAVAELTVEDSGPGIPAQDLPHVFERFYRADPARARDPGGTGLGLPIARWIVEQHGGEISLASEPGRGTTATIRLPVGP